MSVVTAHEASSPFAFVEVADGRLRSLQLPPELFDRMVTDPATVGSYLTGLLNVALRRHRDDLIADVQAARPDDVPAAEREAVAFLDDVLARTESPDLPAEVVVTGRGSHEEILVEAGVEGVARIVVPDHVLTRDRVEVEEAVVAACNEALVQVDEELDARLSTEAATEAMPSWESLVEAIRKHQRTEYR